MPCEIRRKLTSFAVEMMKRRGIPCVCNYCGEGLELNQEYVRKRKSAKNKHGTPCVRYYHGFCWDEVVQIDI